MGLKAEIAGIVGSRGIARLNVGVPPKGAKEARMPRMAGKEKVKMGVEPWAKAMVKKQGVRPWASPVAKRDGAQMGSRAAATTAASQGIAPSGALRRVKVEQEAK